MNIFKLIQREPKMTKAQMVDNVRLLHSTVDCLNNRISEVEQASVKRDLDRITDYQLNQALNDLNGKIDAAVAHFKKTAKENNNG